MAGRTVDGIPDGGCGTWFASGCATSRRRRSPPRPAMPDVPADNGGRRAATIGDCFTSEKAVAMLLRLAHLPAVRHLLNGEAGPRVTGRSPPPGLPGAAGDPSTWSQAHEDDADRRGSRPRWPDRQSERGPQGLADGRPRPALGGETGRTTPVGPCGLPARPNHRRRSATVRNSFRTNFDESGLPPAPVSAGRHHRRSQRVVTELSHALLPLLTPRLRRSEIAACCRARLGAAGRRRPRHRPRPLAESVVSRPSELYEPWRAHPEPRQCGGWSSWSSPSRASSRRSTDCSTSSTPSSPADVIDDSGIREAVRPPARSTTCRHATSAHTRPGLHAVLTVLGLIEQQRRDRRPRPLPARVHPPHRPLGSAPPAQRTRAP